MAASPTSESPNFSVEDGEIGPVGRLAVEVTDRIGEIHNPVVKTVAETLAIGSIAGYVAVRVGMEEVSKSIDSMVASGRPRLRYMGVAAKVIQGVTMGTVQKVNDSFEQG